MQLYLTWFDGNSWMIEMAGSRILLDPWLVGELVFGGAPWFFRGTHASSWQLPQEVDLILLSQGLPDHTHPETLQQLDKNIPVVGSPNAAKVVQQLGFKTVTSLSPGESFCWQEKLEIAAFPGSPIGPTLVENAFVLKDLKSQGSLYYEPHGYHSAAVKTMAPVDVIITPLVDLALPVVGSLIRGGERALVLAQWLQPQIMLPSAAGGEVQYTGLLNSILSLKGSVATFRDRIRTVLPDCQVIDPKVGDRMQLLVKDRVARAG
jgi:L-ascorbate metabolism protein UlaG (beta-lactamase superfamily)